MKQGAYIVLLVLAFILGALFFRACGPAVTLPEPTVRRDTVVIRDTVWPPVPEPEVITVVGYDTIAQNKPVESVTEADTIECTTGDTIAQNNDIIIPITRNTYRTDDYTAVVEGYKPRLVSIELYPKTVTINKTRSPRWALTVGPGIGYAGGKVQPYIGVTVGVVLWSK